MPEITNKYEKQRIATVRIAKRKRHELESLLLNQNPKATVYKTENVPPRANNVPMKAGDRWHRGATDTWHTCSEGFTWIPDKR